MSPGSATLCNPKLCSCVGVSTSQWFSAHATPVRAFRQLAQKHSLTLISCQLNWDLPNCCSSTLALIRTRLPPGRGWPNQQYLPDSGLGTEVVAGGYRTVYVWVGFRLGAVPAAFIGRIDVDLNQERFVALGSRDQPWRCIVREVTERRLDSTAYRLVSIANLEEPYPRLVTR
jgi:hypothetical protein